MKNKLSLKLRQVDLSNPEEKKLYNEGLFSVVAPKYDFITKALSFGRDKAWKKLLIKHLPYVDHARCLDIACGTGELSFGLANKYKNGTVTGIDLNEDMILLCRNRQSCHNIVFKVSDMNNMKWEDSTFDIVTGGYAIRNSPDLQTIIRELYRFMKKGGHAAFLDFSKSPGRSFQKIQLFLLKLWGSFWGLLLHGNADIYAYIAESLKHFPDRNELESLFRNAGFKNVRTKILFFGFTSILFFEK